MDEQKELLIKSALLHDIGKHCQRAGLGRETHSREGVKFLNSYLKNSQKKQKILKAIKYHHAKYLKSASLNESDDTYIIYESDNIASGIDRRKEEEPESGRMPDAALYSVFNRLTSAPKGVKHTFLLRGLNDAERVNYPIEGQVKATREQYHKLVQELESNLQRKSLLDMSVNELLHVLEGIWSYIPDSTLNEEVNDISLYDHTKITAAVATCIKDYLNAQGITDYRTWCYGSRKDNLRQQPIFLLVSGDLSGIQDFIYTIPNAGALKGLRGRSFYLELLLEHVVDELCEQCNISRCNLLYTGGGHFYLLAPNTDDVRNVLEQFSQQMNQWLLEHYGTALYLAMGHTACTAEEFMHGSDEAGYIGPFQRVGRTLAQSKLSRYNQTELSQLFNPDGQHNWIQDGMRECSICHTSVRSLSRYKGNPDGDTEACETCNALWKLGEKILTGGNVFFVQEEPQANAIPLPGFGRTLYVNVYTEEQAETAQKQNPPIRLYTKNCMKTGQAIGTHLWVGDYFAKRDGGVMDFADLAQASGGKDSAKTIRRLGVLRADVDNLGAVFMAGLSTQYRTLSRQATLSRQLSLFFKHYINAFCQGELTGTEGETQTQFKIFPKQNKPTARQVHIVYSGGDDLFFVGAWDDLVELAIDIREAFRRFTCGQLTFSAGLALVPPKFPVMQMAKLAGSLEDLAKKQPTKDSIALFGASYTTHNQDIELTCEHIYQWNDFVERVCHEKLTFLEKHLDWQEAKDSRLPVGKSLMYRLMELLRAEDKIYLARFAYTLARLQPKENDNKEKDTIQQKLYREFTAQMYQWYQNPQDKKALVTALQLIIYSLRDKTKEA